MEVKRRRDLVLAKGFEDWYCGATTAKKILRDAQKPYDGISVAEDAFYEGADVERKRNNAQLQKMMTEIEMIESRISKFKSPTRATKLLDSLKEMMRKTVEANSGVETAPPIVERQS
ncbi:MAG: hypothetical protein ABSD68_01360 [Candidatus Micrarchaeales archaeon]|jgi:hypothetical protein